MNNISIFGREREEQKHKIQGPKRQSNNSIGGENESIPVPETVRGEQT